MLSLNSCASTVDSLAPNEIFAAERPFEETICALAMTAACPIYNMLISAPRRIKKDDLAVESLIDWTKLKKTVSLS